MIPQPTNHAYSGVSLPTLRLVLGLLALAISFYYSFKFLSVGTTGFELFSALAFVAITEATKAMYCHDIVLALLLLAWLVKSLKNNMLHQ